GGRLRVRRATAARCRGLIHRPARAERGPGPIAGRRIRTWSISSWGAMESTTSRPSLPVRLLPPRGAACELPGACAVGSGEVLHVRGAQLAALDDGPPTDQQQLERR